MRINCGGSLAYTDEEGSVWAADNGYTGGTAQYKYASGKQLIDTQRYFMGAIQNEGYKLGGFLPGQYQVSLFMSELYLALPMARYFTVQVEDQVAPEGSVDVFSHTNSLGGVYEMQFIVDVLDGSLDIVFGKLKQNPIVNAIGVRNITLIGEEVPTTMPPTLPAFLEGVNLNNSNFKLINCGMASAYTDSFGNTWEPTTAYSNAAVLYSFVASGNRVLDSFCFWKGTVLEPQGLDINVTPGTYNLRFIFMDNTFGIEGQRTFGIKTNGLQLKPKVIDVAKAAGGINIPIFYDQVITVDADPSGNVTSKIEIRVTKAAQNPILNALIISQ